MIKRSFFATKPRFEYDTIAGASVEASVIPLPEKATLFLKQSGEGKPEVSLKKGDRVKTGQKITGPDGAYIISSVTGTVSEISSFTGDFGKIFTAIKIDVEEDEFDNSFEEAIKEDMAGATDFFGFVPGNPCFKLFNGSDEEKPDTLVICGVEKDLLITTNQFVMKSNVEAMNKGISAIKKLTGIHKVVIALPESLVPDAGAIGGASGVELRVIDTKYPAALPKMIMNDVMGQVIPAGKDVEDMGYFFVGAEVVASIGKAMETKKLPVTKILTFIKKDLTSEMVEVRIGTPIKEIFKAFDQSLFEGDRIISGGPMTGSALYSEDYPVCADTDAIMIQDGNDVAPVSDISCINCGDCIDICPANVPVSMLVRFLAAGQYEDGAQEYDLYSCVECGLCSFVCVSEIPIFQYIRLAKYELAKNPAEDEAEEEIKEEVQAQEEMQGEEEAQDV